MRKESELSVKEQAKCICCCEHESEQGLSSTESGRELEALYHEETDWLDVDFKKTPEELRKRLSEALQATRRLGIRLALSRLQSDSDALIQELGAWLGKQASKLDQDVGLIEVFAGRARLSEAFQKQTNKCAIAIQIGLDYGQDLRRLRDHRCLLALIALTRPDHVWFAPPCECWGPWARFKSSNSDTAKDKIEHQKQVARRYLHNVSECWHLQLILGGQAHMEVGQCALGLRSPKSNLPILKPTRIVSSQESLMQVLQDFRCDKKHQHDHLEGSYKGKNLTIWAESYPPKFARILAEALSQELADRENRPDAVSPLPKESVKPIVRTDLRR